MSSETKTHYRKVFKSDHLGVADLEDFIEAGSNLIFTIRCVSQEIGAKVAGKKIDANIAYFAEKIKPLVLNAGNSKIMKDLAGSCFVEHWNDITVQLYIEPNAKLKGAIVGGVRVSPNKVHKEKQKVTRDKPALWKNAVTAYKRDSNFDKVLVRADISKEDMQFIIDEVASGNL